MEDQFSVMSQEAKEGYEMVIDPATFQPIWRKIPKPAAEQWTMVVNKESRQPPTPIGATASNVGDIYIDNTTTPHTMYIYTEDDAWVYFNKVDSYVDEYVDEPPEDFTSVYDKTMKELLNGNL